MEIKKMTNAELFQRMKEYMDELIAREMGEVKPLKTEKRVAEVGENIVITNEIHFFDNQYKNGDVFTVDESDSASVLADGHVMYHEEYEVLIEEDEPYLNEAKSMLSAQQSNRRNSANEERAELIEFAKEFIEHNWNVHLLGVPEFRYKESKRRITCLIKGIVSGRVFEVGRADCMPGEVFNEWIGKAIALARALDIDVPEEFLRAVQPTKFAVGQVTQMYEGSLRTVIGIENKKAQLCSGGFHHFNELNDGTELSVTVTNDTNAIYSEVTTQ